MSTLDQNAVSAAGPAPVGASPARPRDPKLEAACREFEGLLLGSILKQGLSAGIDDEEQEGNVSLLTDFAAEQTAREIGQAGTLGIADMIYDQMSGHRQAPVAPLHRSGARL